MNTFENLGVLLFYNLVLEAGGMPDPKDCLCVHAKPEIVKNCKELACAFQSVVITVKDEKDVNSY